jgi:ferric-dicitrate binding protein FerR (iron transport regulator)
VKQNDSSIFHYLISHGGFRNWVQNPDEESNYFWRRWIDEHPENISDINRAKEFILRLRFRQSEMSSDELDELLGKVLADESSPLETRMETPPAQWWQKVAAIFLLGIAASVCIHEPLSPEKPVLISQIQETKEVLSPTVAVVHTGDGERSEVTLPDGTKVNVSYQSTLRYPRQFDTCVRRVELVGEAFFQVVHNDSVPFIVEAGGVETRVLGTSFNINSPEGGFETEISLVTGRIRVTRAGDQFPSDTKYLSPGQQLEYSRRTGRMTVKSFDVITTTAWKDGILVFKDAGFDEFIERLGKWYGVEFQVYGRPTTGWKVNGRYHGEKLEDILSGLKFIYGLDYRIQGKNVLLKFEAQ